MILNKSSLKCAAHQGSVINLKGQKIGLNSIPFIILQNKATVLSDYSVKQLQTCSVIFYMDYLPFIILYECKKMELAVWFRGCCWPVSADGKYLSELLSPWRPEVSAVHLSDLFPAAANTTEMLWWHPAASLHLESKRHKQNINLHDWKKTVVQITALSLNAPHHKSESHYKLKLSSFGSYPVNSELQYVCPGNALKWV